MSQIEQQPGQGLVQAKKFFILAQGCHWRGVGEVQLGQESSQRQGFRAKILA